MCEVYQGLTTTEYSWGGNIEQSPILTRSAGANMVTRKIASQESYCFQKALCASPLCAYKKAAKQSQQCLS